MRFSLRQTKKHQKKPNKALAGTSDGEKSPRKPLPKHRNRKLKCAKRSERTIRSSVQEITACGLTSSGEVRNAGENIQFAVAIVSHIKLQNAFMVLNVKIIHGSWETLRCYKDD